MFGPWLEDLDLVRDSFENAYPYKHVVIDHFFKEEIARDLLNDIPVSTEDFEFTYDNPLEKKSVVGDLTRVPAVKRVFSELEKHVGLFEALSGIKGLEYDLNVHGAGVHRFEKGGKLDLHLDYSKHPVTGKERRLNLIVFLSPEWDAEWGGCLELWNSSCTARVKSVTPKFNRAVLFATGNTSWHGVPRPVNCPEDKTRDSIACYFVSDPTPKMNSQRQKAYFVPHPTQQIPPRLLKVYRTRGTRRLAPDDLWDGWQLDPAGRGFWN